jgi:hypothetical protein
MLNPQVVFDVDASEIGLVPGQFPNRLDVQRAGFSIAWFLDYRGTTAWFLDEWHWTPSGDLMYVNYRHAENDLFQLHVWND